MDSSSTNGTQNRSFAWNLASAVTGLICSLWLVVLHLSPDSASHLCGVTSSINCGVLALKEWSEWFGVPTAYVGAVFYGVVLVFTFGLRGSPDRRLVTAARLHALSYVALLTTVYMALVSAYLKTFCPYCCVLYVVSVVFWFSSRSACRMCGARWIPMVRGDLLSFMRRPDLIVVTAAALAFLGAGYFAFPRLSLPAGSVVGEKKTIFSDEMRTLGDPSAPIKVFVFSDFFCPWCKIAGQAVHELEREMRGRVRVVYKFFPLDRTCNRVVGGYGQSCQAALGAYCAGMQRRFWVYHDLIYSEIDHVTEKSFTDMARTAGLDLDAFSACLLDEGSWDVIRSDIEEGIALEIPGTPSIFIDGRLFRGAPRFEALKEAIERP